MKVNVLNRIKKIEAATRFTREQLDLFYSNRSKFVDILNDIFSKNADKIMKGSTFEKWEPNNFHIPVGGTFLEYGYFGFRFKGGAYIDFHIDENVDGFELRFMNEPFSADIKKLKKYADAFAAYSKAIDTDGKAFFDCLESVRKDWEKLAEDLQKE